MHKFLRAIGFSHITKEQLQHIFADIISAPTVQKAALDSEGNEFAELSKEYGDFFGISVRGVYNEDDLRWIITIHIFLAQCYPQENRQKWKSMRKKSPMRGYVMKSALE